MQFPDFPFPEQEESFLHHTEVLSYLEDYAKHYNLHQYIRVTFSCFFKNHFQVMKVLIIYKSLKKV